MYLSDYTVKNGGILGLKRKATQSHFRQFKKSEFYNLQYIVFLYTGRFIMFSVITDIYKKKTKGPTLMEFFTATGKLKKFLLTTRDVRCVHHG
jgi:hypothetical protein